MPERVKKYTLATRGNGRTKKETLNTKAKRFGKSVLNKGKQIAIQAATQAAAAAILG